MSFPDTKQTTARMDIDAYLRITALALLFVTLISFAIHELIALWPTVIIKTVAGAKDSLSIAQWEYTKVYGWWITWQVAHEQRALWLIVFSGLVGSCIHVLTSLATFVGNRTFVKSWTLWYLVRPFIGAGVAFLIISVIWGGIAVTGQGFNGSNPYQLVAVAGLAGMFSKTASDKLQEVFEHLFKTKANDDRRDSVHGTSDEKPSHEHH